MTVKRRVQGLQPSPQPSPWARGSVPSCRACRTPATEAEEEGAEAECGGREGAHSGSIRHHCKWEARSGGAGPSLFIQYQGRRCSPHPACLLPQLHRQMEVMKRLKMETRAGLPLCCGSLSRHSQASLARKWDCQGRPGPLRDPIYQALGRLDCSKAREARLPGREFGRCPPAVSRAPAVVWLPSGSWRPLVPALVNSLCN